MCLYISATEKLFTVRAAECGLMSRDPRRSAAARRGAVREGRPSVTPCPSGRRSGRGAPPGGPPSARSTREPPISPPPPPSEPGGPAPSTPAARRCRRNGCRYAPRRPQVVGRCFPRWIRSISIGSRCAPPPPWPFYPHAPHRPVIARPWEIFAGRARCPTRLRSGTSAVTAARPELSLEPVGTAGTAQHPAAIQKALCDAGLGPPARPEPG